MGWRDFIAVVLIVFLSLWGMLYLEADLARYFLLELFVILLLVIIASGILYGIATEKDWAWSAMTAFFAFALINTVLVFMATRNTTPFFLTLFVNIVGFILCAARAVKLEVIPGNSGMPAPNEREEQIPDLPPMHVYPAKESDLVGHIDVDEEPEDRIYESDLIYHVEIEPDASSLVELETYREEPVFEKLAMKFSKKRAAGKKKPSAGKKKPRKKKR
jgi:hypothetical protein